MSTKRTWKLAIALSLLLVALSFGGAAAHSVPTRAAGPARIAPPPGSFDVVLSAQGEYLDAYFADGAGGFAKKVLVAPDDPTRGGRHLNGHVCRFPTNAPAEFAGKFVVADDTYREACVDSTQSRCAITDPDDPSYVGTDADGWGVFNPDMTWAKKVISTGTPANPDARGTADPQGCDFDARANLIGNDVGSGEPGNATGNIVMFFAESGYTEACFLATNLPQPGQLVIENGRIYVPLTGGGTIATFSAPFPESADQCVPRQQPEGDTVLVPDYAHTPKMQTLLVPGAFTPTALVRRPNLLGIPADLPRWYVASVLVTPTIVEVIEVPGPDVSFGVATRAIAPPFVPANPIGMDVASDGSGVYYAELNLNPDLSTGCGRVSLVRIDPTTGTPQPPQVMRENLQFPDGITVLASSAFDVDFASLPDAPAFTPANCSSE